MKVTDGANPSDQEDNEGAGGDDAERKVRNRLHSLNKDDGEQDYVKSLKTKDGLFLDTYIDTRLKSTRKSICEGMVFAMERHHYSQAITAKICDAIKDICRTKTDSGDDLDRIKTLLYLASDILFNSV